MGLFGSILKSVANSAVDKIGKEVKVGIGNKIQEGVNDISRGTNTNSTNLNLLKNAIRKGKEEEFLITLDLKEKKSMLGELAKKQIGNAIAGNSSSSLDVNLDVQCYNALIKSIGDDAKVITGE